MPAIFKLLGYILAATTAFLTCSTGINLHHRSASFFGFVLQDSQELAPASIRDRTGQRAVLDHVLHGQAFHSDEPEATNELISNLVVMFTPPVPDPGVNRPDDARSFPSVLSAFLLT